MKISNAETNQCDPCTRKHRENTEADARYSYATNLATGERGVVPSALLGPAEALSYALVERCAGDEANFELSGHKGDLFTKVERLSDRHWCMATDSDGQRGAVPARLLEQVPAAVLHFVAAKAYAGEPDHHEIDFGVGEIAIDVRRCSDARWLHAKNATSGQSGLVLADIFNLAH